MTRGNRDRNYPSHMHFLRTLQLWEPLIYGRPTVGHARSLFFFPLRSAVVSATGNIVLDCAPGATSRGAVPDHRVLSRVSNHSLGQLATNTIPVRHFIRKIFALFSQPTDMQWMASVPPWMSRFDITSTQAGDLFALVTFSLSLFVPRLCLTCRPGERTHALCGAFDKF